MWSILPELGTAQWVFCLSAALLAGLVKGVVGFAMPMIMISLIGSILSPDLALVSLMLPTLITNIMQAFRDGMRAAAQAIVQFRIYMIAGAIALVLAAQLYAFLSAAILFGVLGTLVVSFTVLQLAGWRAQIARPTRATEIGIGTFAGIAGGLSGIWGPPTVAYLTALGTEKRLQMRAQGVIFGLGTCLMLLAHGPSGVVRPTSLAFSGALVMPAILGMVLGGMISDRINQETFRKVTLWVLLIAGLNLVRRALLG